jgi:hypothetical protein
MRCGVRVFIVAAFFVAVAALVSTRASADEQRPPRGLYTQIFVGALAELGHYSYSATYLNAPVFGHHGEPARFSPLLSGAGGGFDVAIGWGITDSLALAVNAGVGTLSFAQRGAFPDTTGGVGASFFAIIADWSPTKRSGWHIQGGLGRADRTFFGERTSSEIVSDGVVVFESVSGPALRAGVGWRAHQRHGFGVLLRFDTAYLTNDHARYVPLAASLGVSWGGF